MRSIMLFLVLSLFATVAYGEDEIFSAAQDEKGVTLTCKKDQCVIKDITIDRGARNKQIPVKLGPDVEDNNFGKRTQEQAIGEHVRGFVLDLKTGSIIMVQCSAPAMHLLATGEYEKRCIEDYHYIKLRFSNRITLPITDALEIDINSGQAVFQRAK